MSKEQYLTAEGAERLRAELAQLKGPGREELAERLRSAIEMGDLSENAEYDAAKEAQGLLEMKISKLQDVVANSRIIDESKLDNSKVQILSKVTIKNQKNKAKMVYTLVSESEADIKSGKISEGFKRNG